LVQWLRLRAYHRLLLPLALHLLAATSKVLILLHADAQKAHTEC
jgi:hypothetical protein